MDEENKNTEEPIEKISVEETNDKNSNAEDKSEKNTISENADNIKNETKETVNKVKETIKNTNFKKDAHETKGFILELLFNPFDTIKRVAEGENIISKVVILMIVYIASTVLATVISLIKYGSGFGIGHNFIKFVVSFAKPIVAIAIPSIIILIMNQNNKKSLLTIISTLVVAYIPRIIVNILIVLDLLIVKITLFTTPIETVLTIVSFIFCYFSVKELFGKENNNEILTKYVIILLVSEFIIQILTEVGIY